MGTWRRRILIVLGSLVGILLLTAATIWLLAERQLRRVHPAPEESFTAATPDSAMLARGEHLVRAVGSCVMCHGEDLGGSLVADAGPMGWLAGTNLTRGRGGVGATLTDADWERAIRHGIRANGRSLILMPSEAFVHFSDEDLSAVVAFLKQLPPVDRELESTHLRIVGRALLATGKLPLLVANLTPRIQHAAAVPRDTTAAYGRYLASVAGCHGCHGEGLSGGRLGGGPPDAPPAANLTPSGLVGWSEADFVRALREGVRPAGTAINETMPWRGLGRMTDAELRALWRYLESVPPREYGNR